MFARRDFRQMASMLCANSRFGDGLRAFDREKPGVPLAIYGSGFYGTLIATSLVEPERVRCFSTETRAARRSS